MDPITLVMIALKLVATKATERMGEQMGESAISSAEYLFTLLRRRSPSTVKQLEIVGELGRNDNAIDSEVIEEVKRVAAVDPEVQLALESIKAAVAEDPVSLQHLTKLAAKIGVVNLGSVQSQTLHF